jgi:hypothetical protein
MDSFFDLVLRIFARLIWGSEEEWYRRKQMNLMIKSLRERHSDWLDAAGRKLEPGLASTILNVYRSIKMMHGLLPAIAELDGSGLSESKLANRLIGLWIGKETEDCCYALGCSDKDIDGFMAEELRKELILLDQQYQKVLEQLKGEQFSDFSPGFFQLIILSELFRYNYQDLLRQFDPSFSINNPRYISSFASLAIAQPIEELLDFFYIWNSFDPALSFERHAELLVKEDLHEEMEQVLYHLKKAQSEQLSSEDLLLLIRIIRQDPDYEPERHPSGIDYYAKFLEQVKKRYETAKLKLERELIRKRLLSKIKELFGTTQMSQVDSYSEKISKMLFEHDLIGYLHALPVAVVKTYLEKHYKESVVIEIDKLLREGFFPDPGFSRALGSFMTDCEDIERLIKALGSKGESFSAGDRLMGPTEIVSLLGNDLLLPEDNDVIEQYTNTLNADAKVLIDKAGSAFGKFHKRIGLLVTDARQKEPRIVTNLRTLSAEKGGSMVEALRKIENEIDLLQEILKHYTITVEYIEKPLS